MDKVTQSNAASAEESAAAAAELRNAQAESMIESVGDLLKLVSGGGQSPPDQHGLRVTEAGFHRRTVTKLAAHTNLASL